MRTAQFFIFIFTVCAAVEVDNSPWTVSNPDRILSRWFRQGKNSQSETTTSPPSTLISNASTTLISKSDKKTPKFSTIIKSTTSGTITTTFLSTTMAPTSIKLHTSSSLAPSSQSVPSTSENPTSESTESTDTTLEQRDNPKPYELYSSNEKPREKLQVKISSNISQVIFLICYFLFMYATVILLLQNLIIQSRFV
ncbi:hypothetical protein WA026_010377 [Henosepilachna vigintioctopunctata]|uniref:Uncharacterized protein n=1 Tax=Henosepilachna vigintioctopunctata TaxID=420089 RepID=A0AAW1VDU8_9CUCU